MTHQTVADIGEFGLIDRLTAVLPTEARAATSSVIRGIGDDAAIWVPNVSHDQVISTDALVESAHFRLDWTGWEDLGHKALAVNLSDIAAMGANPVLAVVTLGLRGDEQVASLEAMYSGMGALAVRHGVVIAGGDIVKTPGHRMISVTAIGEVETGRALLRSGASAGDVVGVTGTIGASAAGLRILEQPRNYQKHTTAPMLIAAHLRPEPRIEAGRLLAEHSASAAMDLSDGLAGDLPKILESSGVSAVIDEDALPVIAAVRALFPDSWRELALHGGEDYELLFTMARDAFTSFRAGAERRGITATVIGNVVAADGGQPELRIRRERGHVETLPMGAFDHFG
jgi:thiamine-monophosphate kinase